MNVDIRSVCRTCLSTSDLFELYPENGKMTERSNEEIELAKAVLTAVECCYKIVIQPTDLHSTKMCENCIKLVTLFQNCLQHASTSDSFLRNCALSQLLKARFQKKVPKVISMINSSSQSVEAQSSQPGNLLDLTPNDHDMSSFNNTIDSTPNNTPGMPLKRKYKKRFRPQERKEIGTTIDPKNILESGREKKPNKTKSGSPIRPILNSVRKKKIMEQIEGSNQVALEVDEQTETFVPFDKASLKDDTERTDSAMESGSDITEKSDTSRRSRKTKHIELADL